MSTSCRFSSFHFFFFFFFFFSSSFFFIPLVSSYKKLKDYRSGAKTTNIIQYSFALLPTRNWGSCMLSIILQPCFKNASDSPKPWVWVLCQHVEAALWLNRKENMSTPTYLTRKSSRGNAMRAAPMASWTFGCSQRRVWCSDSSLGAVFLRFLRSFTRFSKSLITEIKRWCVGPNETHNNP